MTDGRIVAVEFAATAPNALKAIDEGIKDPDWFVIEVAVINATMCRPHQPLECDAL